MLQGDGGEGLETGFCWWFNQETSEVNKDSEDEQVCLKSACFPNYNWLNSTLVYVELRKCCCIILHTLELRGLSVQYVQ